MANTVTECQKQIEIDQAAERILYDDQSSIKNDGSQHSQQSVSSTTSSSRKEKLRGVLIARKKLELAKTRAEEEAESARLLHGQNTKRELRRLQDETVLAELDWKIETEYKEEYSLPAVDDPPIYLKPRVGKQQHSMPQFPLVGDSEPKETGPLPTPKSRSLLSSVTVPSNILRKMGALMMPNIMQLIKQTILVPRSWGNKAPRPSTLKPMYAVLGLRRMAMVHTPPRTTSQRCGRSSF